jgi:hypothetical protein
MVAHGATERIAKDPGNITCLPGLMPCNGTCIDTNVDLLNCGACGNVCPLGKACINGTCTCLPGQTPCNGTCTDTSFDLRNCGACGNVCPFGKHCVSGKCVCPTGLSFCNGICIDVTSDELNCGSCGKACPLGQVCFNGRCLAPSLDCTNGYCTMTYNYWRCHVILAWRKCKVHLTKMEEDIKKPTQGQG